MEGKSYERIAERIGCQPEEITFLTDVTRGKYDQHSCSVSCSDPLLCCELVRIERDPQPYDTRCKCYRFVNVVQRAFSSFQLGIITYGQR